jgi:hypothetical protein
MATRIRGPLKVIAFNANGIGRQLSKQLQDQHIDVALFSETRLTAHERFFIPNYHFHRTDCYPGRKGGTAVAVRQVIPHHHVEATEVCIPIRNSDAQLAAVYKSPCPVWGEADISEVLSLRYKSILAGDLNAKHHFWNSAVSNPSGEKLVALYYLNESEILASQCPTHISPARNGDILNIVIHQNVRLLGVIVSDVLGTVSKPCL